MKFQIKSRWDSSVIRFECELSAEFESQPRSIQLGAAIKQAIKSDSNLRGSDLRGSDLRGSDLRGSDLRGSDLRGSDLRGSDLSGSNLSGSNLSGSDLSGSDLSGSNLSGSNLSGSDLSGSDLRDSNLRDSNLSGSNLSDSNLSDSDLSGSNLRDSNLSGSDLTPIRDDLWAVLSAAPAEAEGLRKALVEGRINGSAYYGECACLIGTIANIRGVDHANLGALLPNSRRPAEMFFLPINKGDTPDNNQFSFHAVRWIDEWLNNMRAAFGNKAG
jgi:uncharacterized protein YjbI with pentapeptide repeats